MDALFHLFFCWNRSLVACFYNSVVTVTSIFDRPKNRICVSLLLIKKYSIQTVNKFRVYLILKFQGFCEGCVWGVSVTRIFIARKLVVCLYVSLNMNRKDFIVWEFIASTCFLSLKALSRGPSSLNKHSFFFKPLFYMFAFPFPSIIFTNKRFLVLFSYKKILIQIKI